MHAVNGNTPHLARIHADLHIVTSSMCYFFAGFGGPRPFNYFVFGAAISEVELDTLTGDWQLLRSDVVMDVGNPINPAIDIGQVGDLLRNLLWQLMPCLIVPAECICSWVWCSGLSLHVLPLAATSLHADVALHRLHRDTYAAGHSAPALMGK
eukprot:GHUV01028500.1.p1 GENE.GHUV01028500.1~~GHUV01028500.1.p1  ORF type:complete len:153 (+),score=20.55 GHUV01028500.1:623-1081(+)